MENNNISEIADQEDEYYAKKSIERFDTLRNFLLIFPVFVIISIILSLFIR